MSVVAASHKTCMVPITVSRLPYSSVTYRGLSSVSSVCTISTEVNTTSG